MLQGSFWSISTNHGTTSGEYVAENVRSRPMFFRRIWIPLVKPTLFHNPFFPPRYFVRKIGQIVPDGSYNHLPSSHIEPTIRLRDAHPSKRTQGAPRASDCIATKGGRDVPKADDHTTKAKKSHRTKISVCRKRGANKAIT